MALALDEHGPRAGKTGPQQVRTESHFALAGFRSFAYTVQPALAAGTTNGPTPAMTSAITCPRSKCSSTRRLCSYSRREFQKTAEKSSLNLRPCWFTSVTVLSSPAQHARCNPLNNV